jgi:hypothetical protein
VREQAE